MILLFYLFDLLISINIGIPSFLFLYNLDRNKFMSISLFMILYIVMFRTGLVFLFVVLILYFLSKILSFKYNRFKNIIVLFVYVSFLFVVLKRSINVLSLGIFILFVFSNKVLKLDM